MMRMESNQFYSQGNGGALIMTELWAGMAVPAVEVWQLISIMNK